jgi:hypothetical protein
MVAGCFFMIVHGMTSGMSLLTRGFHQAEMNAHCRLPVRSVIRR